MKKIILASLVFLGTAAAVAQPISLKPGSTVVINGDVVSCQGPSEDQLPPACAIKQDGYYYRLYAGSYIVESFNTFDLALAGAKKMREAGMCR